MEKLFKAEDSLLASADRKLIFLRSAANVNIRLFADDCIIYHEINSSEDHIALNSELESVSKWCAEWQMTLNINKCAFLPITRKNKGYTFLTA